jgi:hypothetical protein
VTERYSSTLERACSEMKHRLESAHRLQREGGGGGSSGTESGSVGVTEAAAYERDKEAERQKYIAKHFTTDPAKRSVSGPVR